VSSSIFFFFAWWDGNGTDVLVTLARQSCCCASHRLGVGWPCVHSPELARSLAHDPDSRNGKEVRPQEAGTRKSQVGFWYGLPRDVWNPDAHWERTHSSFSRAEATARIPPRQIAQWAQLSEGLGIDEP